MSRDLVNCSLFRSHMQKVKQLWRRLNRKVEEDTEVSRATIEGWLYKRGEVKTSWQKRWYRAVLTLTEEARFLCEIGTCALGQAQGYVLRSCLAPN